MQKPGRMTSSIPTVTIQSTALQMPGVLARLTAFLLCARYAFVQTFHSAGHSDIDVFDQHQQCLVRCTLQEVETATCWPVPALLAVPETLPAHLVTLTQHLVQVCTGRAEHRQEPVVDPASELHREDDDQG
jgi:hypothetical protein